MTSYNKDKPRLELFKIWMILNGSLEVKLLWLSFMRTDKFWFHHTVNELKLRKKRKRVMYSHLLYMSVNSQGTNFEYNNIRDCTIYILIGTEINFPYYRLSNYYIEFSSNMREPHTVLTERLPTPSLHNNILFKHIT